MFQPGGAAVCNMSVAFTPLDICSSWQLLVGILEQALAACSLVKPGYQRCMCDAAAAAAAAR
jgi:hypothetical protein